MSHSLYGMGEEPQWPPFRFSFSLPLLGQNFTLCKLENNFKARLDGA